MKLACWPGGIFFSLANSKPTPSAELLGSTVTMSGSKLISLIDIHTVEIKSVGRMLKVTVVLSLKVTFSTSIS